MDCYNVRNTDCLLNTFLKWMVTVFARCMKSHEHEVLYIYSKTKKVKNTD